jgi:hypothetical protein
VRADADRAMRGIANLLPSAIQAGISIVDAAQLTGLKQLAQSSLLPLASAEQFAAWQVYDVARRAATRDR